jgi:hypothetical protein
LIDSPCLAEKMEASEMVAGFVPTPLMLVGECCLLSLKNDVVGLVPPPPGAANLACRAPTSLNKHCPVKFAAGNVGAASSKIPAPLWLFIGLNQSIALPDQHSAQDLRR